jgi:excisionase family DNA binding protein
VVKKNNSHPSEPLLTLEQVANYLNVHKFTVYRLLGQRLPAFKVGNQWRFKQEMIEAWLMKNEKKPSK